LLFPHILFFFSLIPRPPSSTLFPYTTLFRSAHPSNLFYMMANFFKHSANLPVTAFNQCNFVPGIVTLFEAVNLRRSGADRFKTSDRKSTRLNSSHRTISYAVFCLKKKKKKNK